MRKLLESIDSSKEHSKEDIEEALDSLHNDLLTVFKKEIDFEDNKVSVSTNRNNGSSKYEGHLGAFVPDVSPMAAKKVFEKIGLSFEYKDGSMIECNGRYQGIYTQAKAWTVPNGIEFDIRLGHKV